MDEIVQLVKSKCNEICVLKRCIISIPEDLIYREQFRFTVRLKQDNATQDIVLGLKETVEMGANGLLEPTLKNLIEQFERTVERSKASGIGLPTFPRTIGLQTKKNVC